MYVYSITKHCNICLFVIANLLGLNIPRLPSANSRTSFSWVPSTRSSKTSSQGQIVF